MEPGIVMLIYIIGAIIVGLLWWSLEEDSSVEGESWLLSMMWPIALAMLIIFGICYTINKIIPKGFKDGVIKTWKSRPRKGWLMRYLRKRNKNPKSQGD